MGTPVTFMSLKGPMPILNASIIAASIVGILATSSSSILQDSLSHGTKNLFTANPGASLTLMGFFPIALAISISQSTVSGDVFSPAMTSTSLFIAAG